MLAGISCPWGYYTRVEEIERLISYLDERGIREKKLLASLKKYQERLTTVLYLRRCLLLFNQCCVDGR